MMAKKFGLLKGELDRYALASHQRASAATQCGAFVDEIVPVPVKLADGTSTDAMHAIDDRAARPPTAGFRRMRYDPSMKSWMNRARLPTPDPAGDAAPTARVGAAIDVGSGAVHAAARRHTGPRDAVRRARAT